MAFQQVGMLIAAFFLCAIGVLLLGDGLYARFTHLRVNGNVVGVRQKGDCYYPVYSYMLPTGETFESTADSGSSFTKGKETYRVVPLLVSRQDPLKVSPANSYAGYIIGIFFLAPGAGLAYAALTVFPVTFLTWAILGVFIFIGAMRFRKYIIPKEQRLAPADWKATRKAERRKAMESLPVRQIEDILASPEVAAKRELERKNGRMAAPVVLLFALGLMYGGYHEYNQMAQFDVMPLVISGAGVLLLLLFFRLMR